MRPFESASGTSSVQSSTLNRRTGARWASPATLIICASLLASVVLSSSAMGQQTQSGSGQFRKRSTTSTGTPSAIDPKLRGFLEQQAGIEHSQPRTPRTHVPSGNSSSESRRNSQSSSSAVRSSRSTTSVNGSQTPDRATSRTASHVDEETESYEAAAPRARTYSDQHSNSQPASQAMIENAGGSMTSDREEHSSAIEQTAWEPKSDTTSTSSVAADKALTEFSESAAISELQPTPSNASEPKPAEISVPLKSASESGMFLDLRDEAKPNSTAAAIGERGAEVSIESSPMQVLSRAVAWIVIALCLFSLAALGVRRWQRQRGLLPTPGSRSRVIETLSLGPGRSVSLIEMAGHRALVAFDAGGIKQLVLTPPSFQDELTEADEPLIYERPSKTRTELTVLASETQT